MTEKSSKPIGYLLKLNALLNQKQIRDTGWITLVVSVVGIGAACIVAQYVGYPLTFDFDVFWTASHMWWQGHGADAYSEQALRAAFITATGVTGNGRFGWFYPPHFYLLILPLAAFPLQIPAVLAWLTATFSVFRFALNRIAGGIENRWLLVLGSGGFLTTLFTIQNSLLITGLVVLAADNLLRNKKGAVVSLGEDVALALLLAGVSMKPHLGLLFPILMLYQGRYRAMALTLMATTLFVALAVAVLGVDVWHQYLAHLGDAAEFMMTDGHGNGYWSKSASVYALLRTLGLSNFTGLVVQVFAAFGAVAAVWFVWKKGVYFDSMAATVVAGLMLSPYVMEYDCLGVTVAVVLMWNRSVRKAWLLVALLAPLWSPLLTLVFPYPILPLVDILLLTSVAATTVIELQT